MRDNITNKNKKMWAIGLGALLTAGVLAGILIPVLHQNKQTKNENRNAKLLKQMITATTEEKAINNMQALYKLTYKKQAAIKALSTGKPKTRYHSASELAKTLFKIKNDHHITFFEGKEVNSNLKGILLIATPKNLKQVKKPNLAWPLNRIDQINNKLAVLITFFKNEVVKVENKLENKDNNIEINNGVLFQLKQYELVNPKSISSINQKIKNEVTLKTMPTIKLGSRWKTANAATKTDIEITPSDSKLISKVVNIIMKTKGITDDNNIGTIVIVTIEVSSLASKTKALRYDVELDGFVSNFASNDARSIFLNPRININFVISNKKNILPSEFNDMHLIKNTLKSNINERNSINADLLKTTIDEAMKITFIPNDVTGVLKIKMQLGWLNNTKIIKIIGFKTTSS